MIESYPKPPKRTIKDAMPNVEYAAEEIVRSSPKFQKEARRVAKEMMRAAKNTLHDHAESPGDEAAEQVREKGLGSHAAMLSAMVRKKKRKLRSKRRKALSGKLVSEIQRRQSIAAMGDEE
jgi:hypothetical protein